MNPVAASIQASTLSTGLARLRNSAELGHALVPVLSSLEVEHFCGVALDSQGAVIDSAILAVGTDTMCLADPRIALRWALTRATLVHSVYWAHNHPGGNPVPSPQDLALTQRLLGACSLVGINMVDHLIIAGNDALSIRLMAFLTNGR
jgi:DNA repair protein RadC